MSQPPALMLLGIVIASAVGALVLCALLLRHGVASDSDGDALTTPRVVVFRLVHLIALGCFAISAILGVAAASIAWRAQSRATEIALDDTIAVRTALRQQGEALLGRVDALDARLAVTERRAISGDAPSASPRSADPRPPAPRAQAAAPAASPEPTAEPSMPPLGSAGVSAGQAAAAPPADSAAMEACGPEAHRVCSRVTGWAAVTPGRAARHRLASQARREAGVARSTREVAPSDAGQRAERQARAERRETSCAVSSASPFWRDRSASELRVTMPTT